MRRNRKRSEDLYSTQSSPAFKADHKRGGKRRGTREITGTVSLLMPDGMEYPQKEADRKLQEIVGLTKGAVHAGGNDRPGRVYGASPGKIRRQKGNFPKAVSYGDVRGYCQRTEKTEAGKGKEIAVLKTRFQTEAAVWRFRRNMSAESRSLS